MASAEEADDTTPGTSLALGRWSTHTEGEDATSNMSHDKSMIQIVPHVMNS